MAHFEVGKKVIAITASATWRRGQVFLLEGIQDSKCSCGCKKVILNINITGDQTACPMCHSKKPRGEWYDALCFAPYDDSLSDLTDADILYGEQVEVHEIN